MAKKAEAKPAEKPAETKEPEAKAEEKPVEAKKEEVKPAEKKIPHCPTCGAEIDVKRAKGGYTCACGTYLRGFE